MYYLQVSLLTLGLGLSSLAMQGTVMKLLLGYHFVVPQMLLALVIFLGFSIPDAFGAILVFLLGLLADLSSGILIGPWACAFTIVFALTAGISQRLFSDSVVTSAVAGFFGSIGASLIYLFLEFQFKANEGSLWAMWDTLLLEALLTALLAPPLFWIFRNCFKLVRQPA